MNSKMKRRLGAVTGIIVIVLVAVLAVVGGNTAARAVSIAEALELSDDMKIQVSGNVAENSFDIQGDTVTFDIYDPEADPDASATMRVRYDGGVSATFGNDVTAICTGKKDSAGVLNCSELVTKCPSKYENAEGALSIDGLISYGGSVIGKPVRIAGAIGEGTLAGIDADVRFTLVDPESESTLRVRYDGAIPDDAAEGGPIILTGSIGDDGATFEATDIALGG